MTRLDCALMAAGGMRLGIAHAIHHATHRHAFGRPLIDQPAMANVLADLAVDSEAATTVVMRIAGAVDRAARGDERGSAFRRVALSVTKYWLCKRLASHTVEALECLGGNGYVEESGMPRLYREAPLISIWEGSGNVAALDTLRAMGRRTAGDRGVLRRAGARRRGRTLATTTRSRCCARSSPTPDAAAVPRAAHRRADGDAAAGLPAAAGGATRGRRRLRRFAARPATGASRTARCPSGWTPRPILERAAGPKSDATPAWRQGLDEGDDSLFAGPCRTRRTRADLPDADLRGHRPDRADHLQPARARQRDHAGHAARPRARRRARRPGPAGARHRRVRDGGAASAAATTSRCSPRRTCAGGAADDRPPRAGTVLDPVAQARNHDPSRVWDPMVDYAMMSRFNRGFASLLHANKPTVAKLHGFCVAGGTDIALYADQIIAAADTKIGYPPTRVWGIPAAGMWAHRLGDQRAKRLLFTGDAITGAEAAEWGLAVEAPTPEELDERTEILLERIARDAAEPADDGEARR